MTRRQSLMILAIIVALLNLPIGVLAEHSTNPPLPKSHRIIVKLSSKMAYAMEDSINMASMDIQKGTATPNAEQFFSKHKIKTMKPAFGDVVAWKKRTGRKEADMLFDIKGKFSLRTQRYHGTGSAPELSRVYIVEPEVSSEHAIQETLEALRKDANVEYAEEEKILKVQMIPNDPYFSTDMYGLKAMEASKAWDLSTGKGMVVAVIDTGIDKTHPDIAANVWKNTDEISGNGVDDDHNGFIDDAWGWNFVSDKNQPIDDQGHGTHVSGTIAAVGNNGIGVIGVAPSARVMAVKCLDSEGGGYDSWIARAVIYAANNGADVISLSLGGPGTSKILEEAMDYAYNLGVVIVVAAGNENGNTKNCQPASYRHVITVAASDVEDKRADFSNWGTKVDVAAPGVGILSLRAACLRKGSSANQLYFKASGTSMATPHVSGLAALILSAHPDFSNEQVRQVIRHSAQDIESPGFDIYSGYGRVNAYQALTINDVLEAHIESPSSDRPITGLINVKGSAKGLDFAGYKLEIGTGYGPSSMSWSVIGEGNTPVNRDTLGVLNTATIPDGSYLLRLTVNDTNGTVYEDQAEFEVKYISITSPTPPSAPNLAKVYRPGTSVIISGTTDRPGFQRFRLEWAEGLGKDVIWSTSEITLTDDGYVSVTEGQLGVWDTGAIAGKAGLYQIRLSVDNNGITTEKRTVVYLEPDLVSGQWPLKLGWSTYPGNDLNIARDENGDSSFVLGRTGNVILGPAGFNRYAYHGQLLHSESYFQGSYGQVAVGNIDGESGDESVLLVGKNFDEPYYVRIIKPDNTFYEFSTHVKPNDIDFDSPVRLYDMNGDGKLEILAVGIDYEHQKKLLYIWDQKGTLLSSHYPLTVSDVDNDTKGQFLAVDLNGDGKKEILLTQKDTYYATNLKLFTWDGQPMAWKSGPVSFYGNIENIIAGDPDQDGQAEIIIWEFDEVCILEADGSKKEGWPVILPISVYDVVLADIDRDGKDDIVVAGNDDDHTYITVLKADGTPISSVWPYTSDQYFSKLSIGDVNGDNLPELVIATSTIKNYDTDTLVVQPNPVTAVPVIETVSTPNGVNRSGRYVRNLRKNGESGAGYAESNSYFDTEITVVNSNATVEKSWKIMGMEGYQPYIETSPVLGDFDGNGKVDIAVTYGLIDGGTEGWVVDGGMTVLTVDASYRADDMDWPMDLGDPQNSAVKLTAPAVIGIGLDKDTYTVSPGMTKSIIVTALLSDKTKKNVSQEAAYETADPGIATVDANGTIHGQNPGTTTLTVTLNGKTVTAPINVIEEAGLSVGDVSVTEGDSGTVNAVFTVTLSNANPKIVTVHYVTADGTAKAGVDYIAKSGTLTFAPGVTTQTVNVAVKGDTLSEANETFHLKLSGALNASIQDAQGTATITDQDPLPSITISDVSVKEGSGRELFGLAVLKVTLSAASGQTVTLNYATEDGTAVDGVDYIKSAGILTFAPGVRAKMIIVPSIADPYDEPDRQCYVNLFDPNGATIADSQGIITIVDDDAAPTLTVKNTTVVEGDQGTTRAMVIVTLSNPSIKTVTVHYATADGTAKAGMDYQAQNGTLTFEPGTVEQMFTVPILGDTIDEDNEQVVINLSDAVEAEINKAQGLITISDDDPLSELSISDPTVTEGDSQTLNASVTVTLSKPNERTVTVKYVTANGTAIADKDYKAKSGVLTFAPGVTTQTIEVPIIGESLCEHDETFVINLSNPVNAAITDAQGVVTIADNDPLPNLTINDIKVAEGNKGTVTAVVTVRLSAVCGRNVTVNYNTADHTAIAGVDYTAKTGTLQFAPGVTTRTIPIVIKCDTLDENNNDFYIRLTDAVNASISDAEGSVTIVDDDASPILSIKDLTILEGNNGTAQAAVTVSLSKVTAKTVTADYATADGSAKAGSDYVAQSGKITFNPGETTKTIALSVISDVTDETNEAFSINLSGIANAVCSDPKGAVLITDDDAAPTLSIDDVTVTEGNSGTTYADFTVTLSAASGKTVSVKYATANGTAKAPYDYTAKTGTLTFAPGVTTQTIRVAIKGETVVEQDEGFSVVLSGAVNATVAKSRGLGKIVNDDM